MREGTMGDKPFRFLSGQEYQKRIARLDRKIGANPKEASLYLERARIYWESCRLEEAFEDVERAIELEPCSSQVYPVKGDLLFRLGGMLDDEGEDLWGEGGRNVWVDEAIDSWRASNPGVSSDPD